MQSLDRESLMQNTKKKKIFFLLIICTFDKGIIEIGDIPRVYLSCFLQCNRIVSKSFITEITGWCRCIQQWNNATILHWLLAYSGEKMFFLQLWLLLLKILNFQTRLVLAPVFIYVSWVVQKSVSILQKTGYQIIS